MANLNLPLIHFNDVYRVTKQKTKNGEIDVSQFHAQIESVRQSWPPNSDGSRDGLVLFSGDLFSPSTESSVTRGSHLVPVINTLAPDVALTGNHDFDFGYPHLSKLIQDCHFPWLLSNIKDTTTHKIPAHLLEFVVLEKIGLKIGIIGLIEKEWIETISSWPTEFQYEPMEDVGLRLSEVLRDPNGPHKCDFVIALTHSRLPNDISLAKALLAHRSAPDVEKSHGVDLLLGGHDHFYYVCSGVDDWDGYRNEEMAGTEEDDGVRVIKSGTDFREFSTMVLELVDAPAGGVRRKLIKSIKGKRHEIMPDMPSSPAMDEILKTALASVSSALSAPVCNTLTEWDCRSSLVRIDESAIGNWMADVLLHAYNEAMCVKSGEMNRADVVLICGGTIRGDNVHGPGIITLGDIMEILPFEDPIVAIELDGKAIWDALQASVGKWPAQEGRFPIISGFRVEWDSRKPPGQRVLGIWLTEEADDLAIGQEERTLEDREPIKNEQGGRKYKVVTREYMAGGFDGFSALKGSRYLVDEENGVLMSTIIRRFLLGSQYIHAMKQLPHPATPLNESTKGVVSRARTGHAEAVSRWRQAGKLAVAAIHSRKNIGEALHVGGREHMSHVDCFDGSAARCGKPAESKTNEDLITVRPVVDGRLKNFGKGDAKC